MPIWNRRRASATGLRRIGTVISELPDFTRIERTRRVASRGSIIIARTIVNILIRSMIIARGLSTVNDRAVKGSAARYSIGARLSSLM